MQNSSTEIDGLKILLAQHSCLILDSSSLFSTNIRGALRQLGLPVGQILAATTLTQGLALLTEKKPTLLICSYERDNIETFEMVEAFEKLHHEKNRVALLAIPKGESPLISNGQIDGHIEKPFNIDVLRKTLIRALVHKYYPDLYAQHVRAGDEFQKAGNFALAIDEYNKAKKLTAKPLRACRGLATVYRKERRLAESLTAFREARSFEPLDFQSVIGEFEVLIELGDFEPAADLVPVIVESFPNPTERLVQLFDTVRLANRLDALVPLLRVFRTIPKKTKPLLQAVQTSFFYAGCSMLHRDPKKTREFFEIGFNCTGRGFEFVDLVVREYLRHGLTADAEFFLAKTESPDVSLGAYQRLCFELDCRTLPQEQVFNRGRKLIADGHGTPEFFFLFVTMLAQAGKEALAESVVSSATLKFPFLRSQLYEALSISSESAEPDFKKSAA